MIQKMWHGVLYGTGFCLFYGVIGGFLFLTFSDFSVTQLLKSKAVDYGFVEEVVQVPDRTETTVLKYYDQGPLPLPQGLTHHYVEDTEEFHQALNKAHKTGGNAAITLAKGEYQFRDTRNISVDSIYIRSETGNPYDVVIRGVGMRASGRVKNIFKVTASGFTLDGVTLTDTTHHLIQVAGELNSSNVSITNTIFQNSYEQMLKVSYDLNSRPGNRSRNGLVENCIFQYTQGIAPNYYTGGVDALGAESWIIRGNVFRDIASPKKHISQHAVHFWVNSKDTQVIDNLFIDNDRSIGFGMPISSHSSTDYSHFGGMIEGNVVYHSANGDPFGDVGIILEASPGSVIKDNVVFHEHDYPNGIEYRFEESENILILGNRTNKEIQRRDSASAKVEQNQFDLQSIEFIEELKEALERLHIVNLNHPIDEVSN